MLTINRKQYCQHGRAASEKEWPLTTDELARITPDTIVLIHGLWTTPHSWKAWTRRYESRGYRVLAPAWPDVDLDSDDLQRDASATDPLVVTKVVDHYAGIIRELEEVPIIMGHGVGGLIAQILLDHGVGAAGVAIDPTPVTRAPMLVIAGGADQVSPPPINRTRSELHHKSTAITAYKEFPGRTHHTLDQDGWEEVADYVLRWAVENAIAQPVKAFAEPLESDTPGPVLW
jgi:pimeloyl-ACP methyl ester carboxylesterase